MKVSISPFLAFYALPTIHAVPCVQIGLGKYDTPTGQQKQLNPFTAGQGFDIIQSQDCILRFQNPNYNMRGSQIDFATALKNSRVTASEWSTTPESFVDTCNDDNNGGGSNAELWLTGAWEPYAYAGILKRSNIYPQSNLWDPATVVPYLLPSGKSKITTTTGPSSAGENCQRLALAGGIGISGTVDPSTDYAYAPLFRVALGLAGRYPDSKDRKLFDNTATDPNSPWMNVNGAYVTADQANGGCVVIDFREMPSYMLEVEGYPSSSVRECKRWVA